MRKRPIKLVFLLLFTGLIISVSTETILAQNTITGMVFDGNRKPVPLITVDLLDEYERFLRAAKTNGGGLYVFQGLRRGVYYIRVRADGTNFQETRERVEVGQSNLPNSMAGSETVQLNFTLRLKNQNENTPVSNEVIFAQNVPEEAEKLYENAHKLLEKGSQAEGVRQLQAAINVFPEYFLALDRLGTEYLLQNKFTEAEEIFYRALRVNPKSFSSTYWLAVAQHNLGKKESAAKTLESAVILNPVSINSFFFLGKVRRELKEYDKAEQSLKKADKLSQEKQADIHWELALLYYYNLNRFDDAADQLELYLKTNPKASNKEQINKLIKEMRSKAKQKT